MDLPYVKAPHQVGGAVVGHESPHAALLIDFDNVTMGMRSDLSKELKTLLDSDVIKGKVSVQRAYADWRRYPQYIVPLSEASVDLIFAPAYGSSKKNATDIRMAIDGMELVFVRPEIGTFILLTGDSDFSSLVLKLKEYGKYVIGVGIQESSSDILVQNCDEYYSYTSLTGLTKTTELTQAGRDPWVLVSESLKKMVARGDVMRSDRLKQVLQELDANFDEASMGFSKFSKFLAEASSRGLVVLKKLENGQYEVGPGKGRGRRSPSSESRGRGGRSDRGRGRRDRGPRTDATPAVGDVSESESVQETADDPLKAAYGVLTAALTQFKEAGRDRVRDSDVKRKMLAVSPGFDEAELGFPKFSKFLVQAMDHGVIDAERTDRGNYEVWLSEGGATIDEPEAEEATSAEEAVAPESSIPEDAPVSQESTVVEIAPSPSGRGRSYGRRGGSTRRRSHDDAPPLFEGQVVGVASSSGASAASDAGVVKDEPSETVKQPVEPEVTSSQPSVAETPVAETRRHEPDVKEAEAPSSNDDVDLSTLGLPSDPPAIVRYMTHRYKGVGEKTAETLVERFGSDIFRTLRDDPKAISSAVPANRAEQVLEAWASDYERRAGRAKGPS
ncbi:MAG: NYN domain-containing protein [Longimicrobiales bacterium]|jgi:uncharacterized protein (TIGR00288 family)